MVTTDSAKRDNLSCGQGTCNKFDRFGSLRKNGSCAIGTPHIGTTFRTTVRFGVEPTVGKRFVLFRAVPAKFKVAHAGFCAVVWHGFNDGKPGAAVRATRQGVIGTTIVCIVHFFQASVAHRLVSRNSGGEYARFRSGIQFEGFTPKRTCELVLNIFHN